MSTSTPSTPATKGYTSASGTPTTGSWRHPAMDTIVRRQSKQKGLADIHSSRLVKNAAAFAATFIFTWLLHTWLLRKSPAYGKQPERHPVWDDIMWFGGYILNTLRIVLFYNIGESTYRLLCPEPDFSDLPLTPMQRQLLGLDPNAGPSAPSDGIITPPRYARSAPSSPSTIGGSPRPRSTSPAPSGSSSYSATPPYRATSILSTNSPRHTSYSSATDGPMTPSPLRSTVRGGTMAQSLGFSVQSGTTVSPQSSIFNTPSPINRAGQGLGLGYGSGAGSVGPSGVPVGNRWVYEKMGRRGEGLRWTPGRNSVFSPMKGQVN